MRTFIRAILILFFLSQSSVYAENAATEAEVKAAFIYHFINYTQWEDSEPNYYVCIPEDENLRDVSNNILQGKVVNGRQISVVEEAPFCHILVSSFSPKTENTLTIGNLSHGALLEFRVINNKLRFAADLEKVKNSKLKISSQLLKMAVLESKKL